MTTLEWLILLVLIFLVGYMLWRWRDTEKKLRITQQRLLEKREQLADLVSERTRLNDFLYAISQVENQTILLIDESRTVVWVNDNVGFLGVEAVEAPIPLNRTVRSYEVLDLVDLAFADNERHERQYGRKENVYYAQALKALDEPQLVALAIEDVTELQRLGRARRDFVANISHDLRTPITAIQVMIETLQGAQSTSISQKKQNQLMQGISDQTAMLQQLAQELLDLSLIESGRMPLRLVETPVNDLIEQVIQHMSTQAERKELKITAAYEPTLAVLADPDSIRRVLQNLIHNAIKFTQPGGQITIGAMSDGEDVRFSVQDTGAGLEPDDINRIFERFYKGDRMRTDTGTGLGLSIARHIIEGHGGKIWVESQLGEGSTFYFTLLQAG